MLLSTDAIFAPDGPRRTAQEPFRSTDFSATIEETVPANSPRAFRSAVSTFGAITPQT